MPPLSPRRALVAIHHAKSCVTMPTLIDSAGRSTSSFGWIYEIEAHGIFTNNPQRSLFSTPLVAGGGSWWVGRIEWQGSPITHHPTPNRHRVSTTPWLAAMSSRVLPAWLFQVITVSPPPKARHISVDVSYLHLIAPSVCVCVCVCVCVLSAWQQGMARASFRQTPTMFSRCSGKPPP